MYEMLYQFMYLGLSATFIAGVWWGTLRLLDKALGIDFKTEFKELAGNDLALAIYFSARLLALAILFAPLLRLIF